MTHYLHVFPTAILFSPQARLWKSSSQVYLHQASEHFSAFTSSDFLQPWLFLPFLGHLCTFLFLIPLKSLCPQSTILSPLLLLTWPPEWSDYPYWMESTLDPSSEAHLLPDTSREALETPYPCRPARPQMFSIMANASHSLIPSRY